MNALYIGKNRECFFDEALIDTEKTTAEFRLHAPIPREVVLTHDAPWEGDGSDYHNLFFDASYKGIDGKNENGTYRLYYLGWQTPNGAPDVHPWHPIVVCYAESADGIHFIKPKLGISEFMGNKENNIILGDEMKTNFDNFMVFRDENPACPPQERYKGIASYQDRENPGPNALYCYPSADGIHFTRGAIITDKGMFDTLNVIFWDAAAGLYRGYIRGFHDIPSDNDINAGIRDIRYIESRNFHEWSEPELLDFADGEDYPLYTNVVSPYERAPQLLLGFPTRYMERHEWNGSFDELCGSEKRKERITVHPRYGLTITDCVFMCSRDGKHFFRFEDAFMRPGPENGMNWMYGDCYPARGFVETASDFDGADKELSMYLPRNHWMNVPIELQRYTIRLDGFVSLHAGYRGETVLVTKPFIYDGSALYANLSTSARGQLFFSLQSDDTVIESCETFGDSTDRRIIFGETTAESEKRVSALSGKPVILTVRMKDADLYAIRFS